MFLHVWKASRSMIEHLVETLCHAVWHIVADIGCAETHGCGLVGQENEELVVVELACRFNIGQV
jgi:hypothetical protein